MQETAKSARVFRFGVFEVDAATGELRKQGLRIRLQEQPAQFLLMLLDRAGEVVSREEIRRKLWPPDTFVDFDQGLGASLRKLRQALGDDAETPRYIETIPKQGFRFVAPVERISALPQASNRRVAHPRDLVADSGGPPGVPSDSRACFRLVGCIGGGMCAFFLFGLAAAYLPGRTCWPGRQRIYQDHL